RLARLADVLRTRRHRQLAVREAQPERRVPLREHSYPPHDLEQLGTRQRQLVLEALREELLVVRELAVDAARREPDAVRAEEHLVLLNPELDLTLAGGDPRQLSECAGRDDRLELRQVTADRRLADRQAVRVGRSGNDA